MEPTTFPEHLIAGYRSFLDRRYAEEREHYESLADSQSPSVMVIACCDSRVSPTVIFDAMPGELFTVRNVANLAPPYAPGGHHSTSAALEFAVLGLQVRHIVVLGHARCGGVMAYGRKKNDYGVDDFIGQWMAIMAPAAEAVGVTPSPDVDDDALVRLEHASIRHSIENLRTFPCVRIKEEKGRLSLHGAYFSIASGMLEIMDPASGRFEAVGRRSPFKAEAV